MSSDRRDYDVAASQSAQDNFTRIANHLESLIDQRDKDVNAAMSDYQAQGVSSDYQSKETRWKNAASETKQIIAALRATLQQNDDAAQTAMQKAQSAVNNIG